MTIAIQFLVFVLIIVSIISIIFMPITLASPGEWERSKNLVYTGAGIWSILVIVTGLANTFLS